MNNMDACKQLIFVNGINKTKDILSCELVKGKYNIVFKASSKIYTYDSAKVKILENCLFDDKNRETFQYFKEVAEKVSLIFNDDINILKSKYDRTNFVGTSTVLAKYLDSKESLKKQIPLDFYLYPFGLNKSQKQAVENAFSSQISIIQGPPGTGKTQTILNILANAVKTGKTVAVVSNNNSAILNVVEKLEKRGLSFLTAVLGSNKNKELFIEKQSANYPCMKEWVLQDKEKTTLEVNVKHLSEELNKMLDYQNRAAVIEQELSALKIEQNYFETYNNLKKEFIDVERFKPFSTDKILSLWLEYEDCVANNKLGFLRKLWVFLRYGRAAYTLFKYQPEEVIPFLQSVYYKNKIYELELEKTTLLQKLASYQFAEKMTQLQTASMHLFKAELANRYAWQKDRVLFSEKDFYLDPTNFTKEYPVILSTTYSIKGTLSPEYVYDYLIVDEASQVDLATGALALACAKNIVVVGDQNQLPNVITRDDCKIVEPIWEKYNLNRCYCFTEQSLLSSIAEYRNDIPSVLLKEHYRCHPKIAGFFNQKFYNGELIIMTQDKGEENVLAIYRTVTGNHARGHFNQRQIDVIKDEVIPELNKHGFEDIGIITPYVTQVKNLKEQLGEKYEIDTVHKFQGREKEAIILSSVDNVISSFVDNPNMLNVAVSRAVNSLSVVISNAKENERTNYGDLAKYIEYNNYQVIDSKVSSVFDLLYKAHNEQRIEYLKKHKKISEYESENLAYSVIEEVLKMPAFFKLACSVHLSLANLIKDYSILDNTEIQYASNYLTHLDFLLFNKMDKTPVLAIEIDGVNFHLEGSRQAERDAIKGSVLKKCGIPLLRIKTNESGEREKIIAALSEALQ